MQWCPGAHHPAPRLRRLTSRPRARRGDCPVTGCCPQAPEAARNKTRRHSRRSRSRRLVGLLTGHKASSGSCQRRWPPPKPRVSGDSLEATARAAGQGMISAQCLCGENARLCARTPTIESRSILYNAPPSAPWDGVHGLAWPSLTAGKGNDATGLGRQIKHLPNLLHPGNRLFTGAEP